MSNNEVLDAIADLSAKFDMFVIETKASLAKLEAKKTTRSTGGGAKKSASNATPTGARFPPNFMTWYRKLYQSEPNKALGLVPPSVKDDLEDFKNAGDEKYAKKNDAAKRSAEATYLWRSFSKEIKDGVKEAYTAAKEAHQKAEREKANVETESDASPTTEESASTSATETETDSDLPVTRQRRTNKRQVVVD